jgi:hypothetical protein
MALALLLGIAPASTSAMPPPEASPKGGKAGPKTVSVDCSRNQSIQAALADKAAELIVEIEGFCHEKVVVARGSVTLRGVDPALDGIDGDGVDLQGDLGLVMVMEADQTAGLPATPLNQSLTLENLTIRNSAAVGLVVVDSTVGMTNVHVVDNGNTGAHVTSSSFIVAADSHFSGNAAFGVRTQRNASFNCDSCTIEDNGTWGMSVALNGIAFLSGSSVSGTRAAQAFDGGKLTLVGSSVAATNRALFSWNAAIEVETISVDGPIWAGQQSSIYAWGLTQNTNAGINLFYSGASLHAEGDPSAFVGNTTFESFAHGVVYEDASFDVLQCTSGGEFACNGNVTANSTTCGCP